MPKQEDNESGRPMPADYCAPKIFQKAEREDFHDGPDDNPVRREAAYRQCQLMQAVRKARKGLWNQQDFARQVGLSEKQLRNIETGRSWGSGETIATMVAILKRNWLLERDFEAGAVLGREHMERDRHPKPRRGKRSS